MRLNNKTIIVTGASRGVGRAIAAALLKEGATVHGTGRDQEAMTATQCALSSLGGSFIMHTLELSDEVALTAFVDGIEPIDILVNNAGIAQSGPFINTTSETVRQLLEVNVIAPFLLMRQAAVKMLACGGGQIINIASDAALRGIAGMAPYVASKHALLGLGRSLMRELREQGIRVTTYCPGPINTQIMGPGNPRALDPDVVAANIVHLATLPPQVEIREMLVEPLELDIP